jgi:hypothetical protein
MPRTIEAANKLCSASSARIRTGHEWDHARRARRNSAGDVVEHVGVRAISARFALVEPVDPLRVAGLKFEVEELEVLLDPGLSDRYIGASPGVATTGYLEPPASIDA